MEKFRKDFEDWMVETAKIVAEIVSTTPEKCKYCGSRRIVRYGHYQNVQRWWCKDCKRKFIHSDTPHKMKTPTIQIASALSQFYEGTPLNGIRRNLEQTYRNCPSKSTVYEWIVKFTKIVVEVAKDYKPNVGDTWVADETSLKVEGQNTWFWDIIDDKTRFLLASHISVTRTTRDARTLMERASNRAGKVPKVIITDKLQAYLDGIELAFGADTKHIQVKGLTGSKNLIERFHGTLKARTKVMKGLQTRKSAKLFTDGWLVHYNFFRPHEGIGNRTPAYKAGIKFPFRDWLDIVRKAG